MVAETLQEQFLVSTPIEDDIRDARVHEKCAINILDRITDTNLVELPMHNFVIILGVYLIHKF